MPAEVESMFYVGREKPWHGLGTSVEEAPNSEIALHMAGLNWNVLQEDIYTEYGVKVNGFKANVRDKDHKVLGVVSDRYKVVQNRDTFAFTDSLLGEGVRYETAGSLQEGKKVWLLARLPREYIITGERISPYLVFSTTHDGSGAVKVAITPIRVVCNNTLNLALRNSNRSFSMMHTSNIDKRIQEAHDTLFKAEQYMDNLGSEIEHLKDTSISLLDLGDFVTDLLPLPEEPTEIQQKNITKQRDNLIQIYKEAPDLRNLGNNAYRFINAVSDFATHAEPLRRTQNYNENLFMRTIDGNPLIDRAYELIKVAA